MKVKKLTASMLALTVAGATCAAPVNVLAATQPNGTAYASLGVTREAANELNEEVASEGIILMKNENNTLPFVIEKDEEETETEAVYAPGSVQTAEEEEADGPKVTVFGTHSASLYTGGAGVTGSAEGLPYPTKTIYDSLKAAGISYNKAVAAKYPETSTPTDPSDIDENFGQEGAADFSDVEDTYAEYGDAAFVVISRNGSENADTDAAVDPVTGKHALELTDSETQLLDYVKGHFDKVIVLLNVADTMEVGDLQNDPDVDAILWIGLPGTTGIMALGEVLTGEVNPSGRTVDVWASDFTKDPTYANFGDYDYSASEPIGVPVTEFSGKQKGVKAVEYEESIYVGYRYYETRGYEASKEGSTDDFSYEESVTYPFGYGLSYTSFDWEITDTSIENGASLGKDDTIEVTVKVTNTGDYAGKDVVELYYTAPYTAGGIEKSYVVLGAYGKTSELAPGESEELTLSLKARDMSSYDYNDANQNGSSVYELEAGTYEIKLQSDSHTVKDDCVLTYNVDETMIYDTDDTTGATIENKFTYLNEDGSVDEYDPETDGDSYYYNSLNSAMTLMSRADFAGTFPQSPTEEEYANAGYLRSYTHTYDETDESSELWNVDSVPESWSQIAEDTADEDRTVTITYADMKGVALDDPKWDEFLNQLKFSELVSTVEPGSYGTAALDVIGKVGTNYGDGLACMFSQNLSTESGRGTQICNEVVIAATWNTELVEELGEIQGETLLQLNMNGCYAPALNTHRSPFGGRNFEYYSEDPYISGTIASAFTKGVQSKGVTVFLKHFALNDQETNREKLCTYASEQAIREIYLKAFEKPVKDGANGIMVSMNAIGTVYVMNNYQLITGILCNEWGFHGIITTDAQSEETQNTFFRVGITAPICFGTAQYDGTYRDGKVYITTDDGTEIESPNAYYYIRTAAQKTLYTEVNASAGLYALDLGYEGRTLDATAGATIDSSVAAQTTASNISYDSVTYSVAKDSTLPEGLSLDENGRLTGSVAESGTYTFDVVMTVSYGLMQKQPDNQMDYSDSTLAKTQTFTLNVQ